MLLEQRLPLQRFGPNYKKTRAELLLGGEASSAATAAEQTYLTKCPAMPATPETLMENTHAPTLSAPLPPVSASPWLADGNLLTHAARSIALQ